MHVDLTDILACPECSSALQLSVAHSLFELQGRRHLVEGVFRCSEGHRFPILDEIPRLVAFRQLHPEEVRVLHRKPPRQPKKIEPLVVPPNAVESDISRRVADSYGLCDASPTAQRMRAAAEVAYLTAEYRGNNKRKYGQVLKRLVPRASTVLDVGGSLPGLISCLRTQLGATCGIVADIDIRFAAAFKMPTRDVMLVRADAQRLPFKARSFDLAVSAFLLEHVPDWRAAVRSITRVAGAALIAFGPNRWFPLEIGHLNAPLAGTIPKWAAAYVAFAWLKVVGSGRPLARIRQILAGMTYVSSLAFRQYCNQLGVSPLNLFPVMVAEIASDSNSPASRMRRLIRRFPQAARLTAEMLVACGLEPNIYYLLNSRDRAQKLPPPAAPESQLLATRGPNCWPAAWQR